MPKTNWTPEERKAFGDKMKVSRAKKARKAQEYANAADEGLQTVAPTPEPEIVSQEDLQALIRQVNELKAQIASKGAPPEATLSRGGVVGTFEKYSVDPHYYPDPREQLSTYMGSRPELRRVGFEENYELTWEIKPVRYQTIDGVWQSEPRFTVELLGVIYDEDTNTKTNKRSIVRRFVFHEDPDACVIIAGEQGLEVDQENPRQFLDDMRYLRVRDWLHDVFFPGKIMPSRTDLKEEVIGNQLVSVFTQSSEEKQNVPFNRLSKKLQ